MKKSILCGVAASILFCTNVLADDVHRGRCNLHPTKLENILPIVFLNLQVDPNGGPRVIGKKGSQYIRYAALPANLESDMAKIHAEHGFTPHRLRYSGAGQSFERWKYYGKGVEFVFDDKGNLKATRHFPPQVNHMD